MAQPGFGARIRLATKVLTGIFTDPKTAEAAHGLLNGIYPSQTGPMPERGTKEILEGYSSMPWLRAVEQRISQSVAATQWVLYAPGGPKPKKPTKIQRALYFDRQRMIARAIDHQELRQIDEHIMLDALTNSSDYMVGQELIQTTQIHLDLVGEAFWIKERNGLGAPTGFWPVPPNWVRETPTPGRQTYRVEFAAWKGFIPDSEMIWFRHPDPANPYGRGSGIGRALADELETDEFAARHSRMTFINRTRPDFIVWPEETKSDVGGLSPENAARLGERWRNEHQGFWNAAKPFFATRKIGIKELGQTFSELQLVPLRQFERDTIRQVYGVPPEMMGIIAPGSARATIDTGEYIFEKHIVQPRREFLRMYLQERLVPEYDERLIVDFVSTVLQDQQYQLEIAKAAPWSMTVDEWRDKQGMEPLEADKGKMYMVPNNIDPMKDLTVPRPPKVVAAPFGGNGPGDEDPDAMPPKPPKRAIDFFISRAAMSEWGDALTACKDAGDDTLETFLSKVATEDPDDMPELTRRVDRKEAAIRRLVAAQLAELKEHTSLDAVRRVCATGDVDSIDAAVPVEAWASKLTEPTVSWLRDAFTLGAIYGHERIPPPPERAVKQDTFNTVNPEALAWAKAHAGELITSVSEATKEAVRAAVAEALKQGWGAARTAQVVYESIGLTAAQAVAVVRFATRLSEQGLSDSAVASRVARYSDAQRRARALTIARTELMTAANQGQQRLWELAVASGALMKDRVRRKWLATHDELLERLCEHLADKEAPLDAPFDDGTFQPPRHPNCRCAVGLVMASGMRSAVPE